MEGRSARPAGSRAPGVRDLHSSDQLIARPRTAGARGAACRAQPLKSFRWSWPDESSERLQRGAAIQRALAVPPALAFALVNRIAEGCDPSDLAVRSLADCTLRIGEPDQVEQAAGALLEASRTGSMGILCDFEGLLPITLL